MKARGKSFHSIVIVSGVVLLSTLIAGCGSGGSVTCPGDNTICGDSCVDLVSNPDHCGACDNHCPSGNCLEGECVGDCPDTGCDDGVDCTVDSCDTDSGTCLNVPDQARCRDDGDYCNGLEFCDPASDCGHTGDPCLSAGLTCNEDSDECEGCSDDADCDDGLDCTLDTCVAASCLVTPDDGFCDNNMYCDGIETCHPQLDCQAGTAVVCDDTVDCTDDSCDEANDTCEHTANDANCSDALFCNGTEFCHVVDGCGHSGDPCQASGLTCDEVSDTCQGSECQQDSDCDDQDPCNGQETCLDNQCQGGQAPSCDDGNPCTSDGCTSPDGCWHVPAAEGTLCGTQGDCRDGVCQECDWFAGPAGQDSNSGTSPDSPKTLEGASQQAQPGEVVCLLAGTYPRSLTFYPHRSGAPGQYIVYKNYGGEAWLLWNGPGSGGDENMIHFWQGKNYIELRGLSLDGQNLGHDPIKCHASDHIRVIGCTIFNSNGGGFTTKFCDYVEAIGNRIHHCGDGEPSWSSGISLNSHQWTDSLPGFHSLVIGNIISGCVDESDYHTDGNGIIMDLSDGTYDYASADTPPVLVANNVIYQNGGRCVIIFVVTNIWVVNNTCYKNTLDGRLGNVAEFTSSKSNDSYFINNIAYAWNGGNSYEWNHQNSNITYLSNSYFGGANNLPSEIQDDPSRLFEADPAFQDPPYVHPTDDDQWNDALPPDQIADRLQLLPNSPVIDQGFDPRTIDGVSPEILDALESHLTRDILGIARPQGSGFDLGAYEFTGD